MCGAYFFEFRGRNLVCFGIAYNFDLGEAHANSRRKQGRHVCALRFSRVSVYREEKCDVTLPWQQNFWMTTIGSFCNGDDEQQKNKQQVQIGKKSTLHVHHAFLYISQPLSHDRDMKLPNLTRPLYGVGEHNTKSFFFFFLNLGTVLSDLTQKISPTFDTD